MTTNVIYLNSKEEEKSDLFIVRLQRSTVSRDRILCDGMCEMHYGEKDQYNLYHYLITNYLQIKTHQSSYRSLWSKH